MRSLQIMLTPPYQNLGAKKYSQIVILIFKSVQYSPETRMGVAEGGMFSWTQDTLPASVE